MEIDLSQYLKVYNDKEVVGVGLVHYTKEVFFTHLLREIHSMKLPNAMQNKKIYPTVSMESRDDEVYINFG